MASVVPPPTAGPVCLIKPAVNEPSVGVLVQDGVTPDPPVVKISPALPAAKISVLLFEA